MTCPQCKTPKRGARREDPTALCAKCEKKLAHKCKRCKGTKRGPKPMCTKCVKETTKAKKAKAKKAKVEAVKCPQCGVAKRRRRRLDAKALCIKCEKSVTVPTTAPGLTATVAGDSTAEGVLSGGVEATVEAEPVLTPEPAPLVEMADEGEVRLSRGQVWMSTGGRFIVIRRVASRGYAIVHEVDATGQPMSGRNRGIDRALPFTVYAHSFGSGYKLTKIESNPSNTGVVTRVEYKHFERTTTDSVPTAPVTYTPAPVRKRKSEWETVTDINEVDQSQLPFRTTG